MATRIRSASTVTTSGQSQQVPWPLNGRYWTQQSDATNLLFGEVTVRIPAACDVALPEDLPAASVLVTLDGSVAGYADVYFWDGMPATQVRPVSFYPIGGALLAPGTDTDRGLSASVADTCTGVGQDFTFESLKIDVVSVT